MRTTSSTTPRPSASTSQAGLAPSESSRRRMPTITRCSVRCPPPKALARRCSFRSPGGSTLPYRTTAVSRQRSASTRPKPADRELPRTPTRHAPGRIRGEVRAVGGDAALRPCGPPRFYGATLPIQPQGLFTLLPDLSLMVLQRCLERRSNPTAVPLLAPSPIHLFSTT